MRISDIRRCVTTAALGLLLAAGQSRAGVLVDQSPPSTDSAYFADISYPQILADDFTLASAASPSSITFWGSYYPSNTPLSPDLFSLAFYADSAGQPGALVTSFAISPGRTNLGPTSFGSDLYEYNVGFAPVALGAGTYWVSVVNDSSANPGEVWTWASSAAVYNNHFAFSQESSRTPTDWINADGSGDLAFVLSDGAAAVPEPSTFVSACVAGAAFLALRRRAKNAA